MSRRKSTNSRRGSTSWTCSRPLTLRATFFFGTAGIIFSYISISPRGSSLSRARVPAIAWGSKPNTELEIEKARHKREKGKDASSEGEKPCQDRNSPPLAAQNFRGQRVLIDISPIEDLNRRVAHRNRYPDQIPYFVLVCSESNEELKRLPILSLSLRRSLHRLRHAAEIDAVNVHRIRRGCQDILLASRRDIFFQNIEEHVGMLYVGFAMGGEVRHLR